jgi:hypothetical protein
MSNQQVKFQVVLQAPVLQELDPEVIYTLLAIINIQYMIMFTPSILYYTILYYIILVLTSRY